MSKIKLIVVAGARPNFPKIAPILREIKKNKNKFEIKFVHTGQHYDKNMSDSFLKDLEIQNPNINLNISQGTQIQQIANIMLKFEKILLKFKPNYIMVVGDVTSTLACSLTAKKNNIKIIHIESGLRSFDNKMPEEINRILTDKISDLLFVTEKQGVINLKNENIKEKKIFLVGNVMIDTLEFMLPKIKELNIKDKYEIDNDYALITIHRPSNVDNKNNFLNLLNFIKKTSKKIHIVWPIHPRTKKNINKFKLNIKLKEIKNITFTNPLPYLEFMNLVINSKFILTDSGGIQEETTYLNKPCITLRENTERPITIDFGSNEIVGFNFKNAEVHINNILNCNFKNSKKINLWDGKTSKRIIKIILDDYKKIKNRNLS